MTNEETQQPDPQDGTLNGEPLDDHVEPSADTEGMGDQGDATEGEGEAE